MGAPEKALEDLYQAHAGELHAFARRRVGRQDADDVVQDAYLHLLQRTKVTDLTHPRAYLFRIASNLAVDNLRKVRTRARFAANETECLDVAADMIDPMDLHRLLVSLDELPAPCRKAFLLHLVHDLNHAEIAQRLGVTIRTVERHMARARSHLCQRFGR